ncbi:MAG TPA: ABC transporter substrate-binding protein [Solirubrobacterales bacterium]|jgi:NitT/TauT family transport system substrate-binding protein/putative hydroxymethylpyrimidine transport system substrate-binding protein
MNGSTKRPLATAAALLAAAALSIGVAACGGSGESTTAESSSGGALSSMTDATLVLDFIPNGVHAGIYRALEEGYYSENNINLKIIQPTSTADTLKLIDAGKADFGIADGIDVGNQIVEGRDAKGVMALLEHPPGGLITLKKSGITDPKELEGETVGITGVPSDTAILNTVVSDAGGNPENINVVTIGFNGVQNLENEKVAAFTGFVPADGVQVEQNGNPIESFPLDEWGGPSYPGLVVFSTQEKIMQDPALMQAFVSATIKGYEETFKTPDKSIEDLVDANPGINEELAKATLSAYMPLFEGEGEYGEFETKNIEALSKFMVENELAKSGFTPERYGTNEFVTGEEG